jgi:hypothetical protein
MKIYIKLQSENVTRRDYGTDGRIISKCILKETWFEGAVWVKSAEDKV